MITIQDIEAKLRALSPVFLEVIDQTALHQNHYTGLQCGVTHIKVTIQLEGSVTQSPVAVHREIYATLSDYFAQGLHAVEIKLI
ncbi:MAG: BolA family protein [Alphaproteobacteria bacterium]|nr:BolA family protein [Alphaproteobacteria bacterium]